MSELIPPNYSEEQKRILKRIGKAQLRVLESGKVLSDMAKAETKNLEIIRRARETMRCTASQEGKHNVSKKDKFMASILILIVAAVFIWAFYHAMTDDPGLPPIDDFHWR